MMLMNVLVVLTLVMILNTTFFMLSKKEKWENLQTTLFECGFSSYFFSRFNFSIHYYMIALIFLFLDLELCFMMPFLNNSETNTKMKTLFVTFVIFLIMGLILEWKEKKLEWMY